MPSDYKEGTVGMGPSLGSFETVNFTCSFQTVNGSLMGKKKKKRSNREEMLIIAWENTQNKNKKHNSNI